MPPKTPRKAALAGRVDVESLIGIVGAKITNKPYVCAECGTRSVRATNHYDSCYPKCFKCITATKHVYDHKWALILLANNGTLKIDEVGEKVSIEFDD